jgi:hypothetical protein
MSALRRLLHEWAGRLPTIVIEAEVSATDDTQVPLFERSHVITVSLPLIGEVTCYLHHYLRSDPDRGAHDHPWPWAVALPLAGGYREERLKGWRLSHPLLRVIRRRPFLPYFLTGYAFHRVLVDGGRTNWSLFFTGRSHFKPWGFLRPVLMASTGEVVGYGYKADPEKMDNAPAEPWWRTAPPGRALRRAPP